MLKALKRFAETGIPWAVALGLLVAALLFWKRGEK